MSKYILPYEKAARIQTVVCGLLFSVFSFVYLYVFQRDILEAVHFSLAHGKTHFAPMASAVVITFILILLRWGVNSLLGLKGIVRSVAYFPSYIGRLDRYKQRHIHGFLSRLLAVVVTTDTFGIYWYCLFPAPYFQSTTE